MRLAIVTACAISLVCGSVQAQAGGTAQARAHFQTGTRAFEEGDYALAIREFQAAYDITEHPDLLFNIYSAAERAGMLEEAESALARYLELGRPGQQRRSLTARLGRLRLRIEEARAEATPPTEEPLGESSTEPVEPDPPAQPDPPEPIEAAPAEPDTTAGSGAAAGVHPAGVVTLVIAGGLLVSFGVFALLSELEDQALATRCGRDVGATCGSAEVRDLETFNVIADVSWIAGAAAAVIGLVLLVALPAEESSTVAFAPWVTPEGAGAGVVGRW